MHYAFIFIAYAVSFMPYAIIFIPYAFIFIASAVSFITTAETKRNKTEKNLLKYNFIQHGRKYF